MTRITEGARALVIVPAHEFGDPFGLCGVPGCRKPAVVTLEHRSGHASLPLCGEHYGVLLKYSTHAPICSICRRRHGSEVHHECE